MHYVSGVQSQKEKRVSKQKKYAEKNSDTVQRNTVLSNGSLKVA